MCKLYLGVSASPLWHLGGKRRSQQGTGKTMCCASNKSVFSFVSQKFVSFANFHKTSTSLCSGIQTQTFYGSSQYLIIFYNKKAWGGCIVRVRGRDRKRKWCNYIIISNQKLLELIPHLPETYILFMFWSIMFLTVNYKNVAGSSLNFIRFSSWSLPL